MTSLKAVIPRAVKRILFRLFDNIQSVNINAHPTVGDRFGKPFKNYFITENMPERLALLRNNLDKHSLEVIEQKLEQLLQLPAWGTKYQKNMRCLDRVALLYTEEQVAEQRKFVSALPEIKKELKLKTYIPEVVFYHHALRLLSTEIVQRLRNKIFVDCGASYGDSAVVFGKYYSPKKIISFELTNDPEHASNEYYKTLAANGLQATRYELIAKGVSNDCCNLDDGYEFVTVDAALSDQGNIGLIKMDIEGAALDALKGATKVIIDNRPILIISVYHSPREFFEVKPYLESLNLGYKFQLRNLNFATNYELETVLVAFT